MTKPQGQPQPDDEAQVQHVEPGRTIIHTVDDLLPFQFERPAKPKPEA